MTKSQIFKAAHAEARAMVAAKRISYAEAFKFGLRRVYNKIETDRFVACQLAQPEMPKFMWLRGM
jgi:hypothetical protein